MVDYIVVAISTVIFIFYLMTIFMSLEIKRRLSKEASTAFFYMVLAIVFLMVRRIQQIFLEVELVSKVPYFTDFVTLIFSILMFLAIFHFHRSIKGIGRGSGSVESKPKPLGIRLLLGGLATLIVINILSRFDLLHLVGIQPDLLSIITVLFAATELGVRSVVTGKKNLGRVGWFGTVVVSLLFLALASGWIGLTFAYLHIVKGVLELGLLLFVFLEIIN